MKTVGEILKTARLTKQVSLEQTAKATKIHSRFLEALEKNHFQDLPSQASARGFLKNYAEFLGLSSQPILAIFRRDFVQSEKGEIAPEAIIEGASDKGFKWQPKLTLIVVLILFFLGLASYLGYQYFSLSKNPHLELFSPTEGERISAKKIEILGRSDPDSLVTVNGQPVFLTEEGEFRYKLELFSGENRIVVETKSRSGKKTKLERVVFHP